jgi:hypothetical protein
MNYKESPRYKMNYKESPRYKMNYKESPSFKSPKYFDTFPFL